MQRTTTTTRSSKATWLALLLAALLVPLIVAAIAAFTIRDDVQSDLADRAEQALAAAGIDGATVSFDGRDATIAEVPAGAESAAVEAVLAVDGVRVASVSSSTSTSDTGAVDSSAAETTAEASDVAATTSKELQAQIDTLVASQPITFQPNSAQVTTAGAQAIQGLATLLKAAPDARIRIEGHVAGTPGTTVDPQKLSEQRAAAVQTQLIQLGIAADRITAKGFGDTKPIASNSTPEGQAANRRVEIVVL